MHLFIVLSLDQIKTTALLLINMQLLPLIVIILSASFIHAFRYPKTILEDRRLSPSEAQTACDPSEYRLWYNTTAPSDFPLPLSKALSGYLYAPECASRYGGADTWFVSWGADDLLYSAFTDGQVDGVFSISDGSHPHANTTTGHVMLNGSDPLNLTILSPGIFASNSGPYSQGSRSGGGWGGPAPTKIENMFDFLRKILILSAKFVKYYGKFSQKFGF